MARSPRKNTIDSIKEEFKKNIEEDTAKYKRLKDIDLFILDNTIRESTVGQTRGHTIEEKWKIYEEVKKCGFKYIIVASFSHMTRVDDLFCEQLIERGEDVSHMFAFSEITVGMALLSLNVLLYHSGEWGSWAYRLG